MNTDIELVKLLIMIFIFVIIFISMILILRKKIKQKENIAMEEGTKTTAEVIGFRKYPIAKGVEYIIVLKFKDKDGTTHIVERIDGADGCLRYNAGDILEISYLEREKYNIPDDHKISENKNLKLINDYFEKETTEIEITDSYKKYYIYIHTKPTRSVMENNFIFIYVCLAFVAFAVLLIGWILDGVTLHMN